MSDAGYRGRFAPSPTGPLHFGSLLTAFASWIRARQRQGTWLIRIEDLDPPREVPGAAQDQLQTLQHFGFESDEAVLWQSRRAERYRQTLQTLVQAGLAFECFCSRADLATQGGIHRRCVPAPRGLSPAIRARVPDLEVAFDDALQGCYRQHLGNEVGDFVLWRAEGFAAYQLAVVADDEAQRISEVVRGSDLLDSTPRQIWLQRVLGYTVPEHLHLPLALDADGRKLGKSLAALPLDRDDPLPALQAAWRFLGQEPAVIARVARRESLLSSAIEHFDWTRVPVQGAMPR